MSKIIINVPIGDEREVLNTLNPIARQYNHKIIPIDIIARVQKNFTSKTEESLTNLILLNAASDEIANFFNEDNLVIIGPCSKKSKFDTSISYMDEILSAQEEVLEQRYNYKENFILSKDMDIKVSNMVDLIANFTTLLEGGSKSLKS